MVTTAEKTKVSKAVRVALPTMEVQEMTVEDFLEIDPIENQRNQHKRHGKVRGRIHDKTYGTIGIVHLARMPSGKLYVIDGCTRQLVWKMALDGHGINKCNVPYNVTCCIWDVPSLKAAKALYYTIDNSSAAETGSDKITGYFREGGVNPASFSNACFRNGTIGKAIDTVKKKYPSICDDVRDAVHYFKDEILKVDETSVNKLGQMRNVMIAAAILYIHKNPAETETILDMIEDLVMGAVPMRIVDRKKKTWQDPAIKRLHDAYNGLCRGGPAQSTENEWIVSGDNNNFMAQVGFALLMMDYHVQGKTLKSTISEDKAKGYFDHF